MHGDYPWKEIFVGFYYLFHIAIYGWYDDQVSMLQIVDGDIGVDREYPVVDLRYVAETNELNCEHGVFAQTGKEFIGFTEQDKWPVDAAKGGVANGYQYRNMFLCHTTNVSKAGQSERNVFCHNVPLKMPLLPSLQIRLMQYVCIS